MATEIKDACDALAKWQTALGTHPFASLQFTGEEDRVGALLTQAASILSMLSASCSDAQKLIASGNGSEFDTQHKDILGSALDGVGTLIHFASFALEG
jgi:hypothetical protein